jgi:phosphoenolpyruvate carboxykinase (GTP)
LVYEARDWSHGVLVGASVASETTAAATGRVGVVRRDPMAMKPFCGYNFGDYWNHWFSIGSALRKPPRIFHVNWFRQNAAGKFLWPGFGENLRVLSWILERCAGRIGAAETPIGYMPRAADLNVEGLDIGPEALAELSAVPRDAWRQEAADLRQYLQGFGARLPAKLVAEIDDLERRLA